MAAPRAAAGAGAASSTPCGTSKTSTSAGAKNGNNAKYAPRVSPTKSSRTPRQLVLRSRNCSDARHNKGHSAATNTSAIQPMDGRKLVIAQYATPSTMTTRYPRNIFHGSAWKPSGSSPIKVLFWK